MKLYFTAEPKNLVKFFIYAIFLLYLIAIAVLNLNSFAMTGMFWGFNPVPAFGPDFIFTTIFFYIFALVISILSVKSFLIKREKGIGFGKPKKESDGFEKMEEEKKAKEWPGIEHIYLADDEYKVGGVPIILKEKEAWVNNSEDHTIIIGSTGSGKTECGILPTVRILAKSGQSMIVTDPKGEIYQRTGELLKSRGYKIIILNFRDPLHGNAWNPFMLPYKFYKEGNRDKATELLEDLARNILIDPNNKGEPFWENASSDYFSALSLGLFKDAASEDEININSINLMATQGEHRFGRNSTYDKEYFLMKGETSNEYTSASAIIDTAADTKSGVLSTFRTKTRIFSSRDALSEMLSHSDFNFSNIGKEKTAIFMTIHDEKKTYHSLMTIFVKQVYESLIDEAQKCGGKLPVRTNFLLDEFANMPALKDVDTMITASRSRNIRFTFVIQNFAQLNLVYGADLAETIKGNCNIHFLLTTELKALEEISRLCGEKKPKKAKEGEVQEAPRPLVTISDLQHMKKFEYLIKRMRFSPFKTLFEPDFKLTKNGANAWNCSTELAELPTREPKEPKVFDLIEFVNKKKEEMGEAYPGSTTMPGGMIPPQFGGYNPYMMPNPMMGANPSMPNPRPQTSRPEASMDYSDFLKKIDQKIAEWEKEEDKEKEVVHSAEDKINETVNNIKDVNEKLDSFIEEAKVSIDKEKQEDVLIVGEEEKPKINVDKDSIIVNDKVVDDDFFDDFFDE